MSMVEWKKLGEVADLVRGKVISKDYIRDNGGEYPVYSSQTANDGVLGCVSSYMFDGDYLTWTTDGAYAGTIFRRKGKFNITNVCGLIDIKDERLDQCFLYYWLSLTAKSYVLEGMGNPKLMSNVASTIKIPIPFLSEQQRIVSILDTFTSSISNLKQQIEERRKQYEYERDLLLDLEGKEGVEMKTLGDFGDVTKLAGFEFTEHVKYQESGKTVALRGLNVKDGYLDLSQVKYIDGSNFSKLDRSKLKVNDMLFTYVGTIGNVALIDEDDKYYLAPNVSRIRFDERIINPKYALYVFMSQSFHRTQINKFLNSSSMKNLSMENIRKFILPIPSITTQSRIVSILDTFEASIKNLEEQLALREKQYEYYRNQLLTFE